VRARNVRARNAANWNAAAPIDHRVRRSGRQAAPAAGSGSVSSKEHPDGAGPRRKEAVSAHRSARLNSASARTGRPGSDPEDLRHCGADARPTPGAQPAARSAPGRYRPVAQPHRGCSHLDLEPRPCCLADVPRNHGCTHPDGDRTPRAGLPAGVAPNCPHDRSTPGRSNPNAGRGPARADRFEPVRPGAEHHQPGQDRRYEAVHRRAVCLPRGKSHPCGKDHLADVVRMTGRGSGSAPGPAVARNVRPGPSLGGLWERLRRYGRDARPIPGAQPGARTCPDRFPGANSHPGRRHCRVNHRSAANWHRVNCCPVKSRRRNGPRRGSRCCYRAARRCRAGRSPVASCRAVSCRAVHRRGCLHRNVERHRPSQPRSEQPRRTSGCRPFVGPSSRSPRPDRPRLGLQSAIRRPFADQRSWPVHRSAGHRRLGARRYEERNHRFHSNAAVFLRACQP
jgi:hypothetical protein